MQIAHIHEVGHLLGLEHVDIGKPHCPRAGNTNLGPCYGVLDVNKNSVMGMGMQLRPEHATPWRLAMIQIASNWSLKALFTNFFDWTPKLTRHYPRTPAEVAANTLITTRPKR